jgi:hypothetical protein
MLYLVLILLPCAYPLYLLFDEMIYLFAFREEINSKPFPLPYVFNGERFIQCERTLAKLEQAKSYQDGQPEVSFSDPQQRVIVEAVFNDVLQYLV